MSPGIYPWGEGNAPINRWLEWNVPLGRKMGGVHEPTDQSVG